MHGRPHRMEMRIAANAVCNEIGDSSVDCQSYVAFVIDIVGTWA
jgi:hypothetical protein